MNANKIVKIIDIEASGYWDHFVDNYNTGYWKEEIHFDPDDYVGISMEHARLYGLL